MENRVRNIATGIILFLFTFNLIGQTKKLESNDLPQLIKSDTIIVDVEVWVQTPNSEIKQRHKIKVLEKRNEHIKNLIHKKESYESVMDTLIVEIRQLEVENDSLQLMIVEQGKSISSDLMKKYSVNLKRLEESRNQYFILREKFMKVRRALRLLACGNAAIIVLLVIFL